ncbi:hypothetical protein M758_3G091300 [Ceratodon purpureus]|uniref:C3H1-type domain-containing protein n=1 Tax=Ceratodon purpureus TaxID=3225 RepID=A0A8T0IIY1_CERPU|nr:hypothetical protein KC19_3G089100 [Ceratodon purpureus]KAG0622349.1 hypothetical protein M758_3G091300 [Ceratodon purpureus]
MAFTRDRDLYKTKLCTLYLQRGSCPRQSCSFAHGGAELRRMPGHLDARGVGLRNRFERHSPLNRFSRSHSQERRGRGFRRSPIRDSDHSRSPAKRRRSRSPSAPELSECRRNSKNARIEANEPHLSDVSAEDLGTDSPGADKDAKETQSIRNQLRDSLEEQLAEIQDENKVLVDEKTKLELVLESKLHETTELSDKVTILDEKVAGLQEDCKGLASKTRKLVKVFKVFIRAQDDLKKAQAKLIKLVDDVIVESYSKNMDIDSMKVSHSNNAGMFGEYATALDGSAVSKKDAKVETPIVTENRPMSQISDYNMSTVQDRKLSVQSNLQQPGMASTGNNNIANCSSLVPAISGVDEGYSHMFS